MSIAVLIRGQDALNAIDQASLHLASALRKKGVECESVECVPGARLPVARDVDLVVVPYNPFMWGRWGFAPGLVRDVVRIRSGRRRPRIALIIHEPFVPICNTKSLLMGSWQRFQLAVLMLLADHRFASIEAWAAKLSRLRATHHLPSGSNLPDARGNREAARARLQVDREVVIATLSTGHPSHLTGYVEASLQKLVAEDRRVVFLQLGAGSTSVIVPTALRVVAPGFVPADQLATILSGADLLLTPFIDGVSTRRSSFMAGLCEGVAVVGTKGTLTDPMLLGCGLELVNVGNPVAFAERVSEIAKDEDRRRRAADVGRELFESEFTWDAIATRFLDRVER